MQTTFAVLAAIVSVASAQGIAAGSLTPTASAPAGCSTNYAGKFEITVVKAAAKRDLIEKRATTCASSDVLVASLSKGVLTDAKGRIGGIVANRQFQFDGPPSQTGTIYNGGWSVCNNGSLAIGGSAVFYQCLSGSFYNLYDQSTGAQCQQVLIDIIPCSDATTGASAVTQSTDGQPAGASATRATQISDGQIQASSARTVVTQISDGQIQASSARPIPVSQISDGQIQATRPASAPVSQISDGQIQVTSVRTTSVRTTSTAAPVSQISDGQIQVTSVRTTSIRSTSTAAPVSQISDGQIQATSAGTITTRASSTTRAATTTAAQFTGAAAALSFGSYGAAALGAAAMALL